eukprot:GILK01006612.1.p1 GENE.GILK01006612.1~~GILK01006612.1.p1  ORF type:complete len:287 (+),score=53.77 GILK01006612.1:142-1002(+)
MLQLECEEEVDVAKETVMDIKPFLEYNTDILLNLIHREHMVWPDPSYLISVQHGGITTWMREMVIQWMFEVADDLALDSQTTALAIMVLDLFLSKKHIPRCALQLAALACILLAAKMDEASLPPLDRMLGCVVAYKKSDVQFMELSVLKALDWNLSVVTPQELVPRLLSLVPVADGAQVLKHAVFFVELSFCQYDLLQHCSSTIALSSILCAFEKMSRQDVAEVWLPQVLSVLQFNMSSVVVCRESIMFVFRKLFSEDRQADGAKFRKESCSPTSVMEFVPIPLQL